MVFKSTFEDSIPPAELKDSLAEYFWRQLDVFADKILLIDYKSERQWTGKQIKEFAQTVALYLINEVGLKPGGSVCAGARNDPIREHKYMLDVMQPAIVFADASLYRELLDIRSSSTISTNGCCTEEPKGEPKEEQVERLNFKLCILNDQDERYKGSLNGTSIGLHKHILAYTKLTTTTIFNNDLPVQVDPNWPAFVLLTSGSTGKPKPVARSHRNSLYVCYSLKTAPKLWPLNENSVLAGHQPLDHGTGTFNLKMTLSKGLKMIVIDNYELHLLLTAIDRFKVSDFILGSALLHNLMSEPDEVLAKYNLSSLRNIISVGSPLASHELANKFMDKYGGPNRLNVRQACGTTECGFTSIVPPEEAYTDSLTVGYLLPNLIIKLIEKQTGKEIKEFDKIGELLVKGPTVSPGYLGAKYLEQTRSVFLEDGFYKTNDICCLTKEHKIIIKGRFSEILCLGDGWKVLPYEIEQVLIKHPGIKAAAVIGIPHPTLPTCHAPRAYILPTDAWRQKLTERDVIDFGQAHLSEPKQLEGGVRIMEELPRISVGKVDKKALRKMDGY